MAGLLFALQLFLIAICGAVVLAVLFYVPLAIYVIPYALWVGTQNLTGKHLDKKNERLTRTARNATKLYMSWILRKKPTF